MGEFKSMLRYIRNRTGWSQQKLADELGVAKSTISMYENGNREPDFETLEAIADIFNVDVDFLIGRERPETGYYLNDKTRKIAQEVYQNPDLQILFDASKNASPEDIQFAAKMLERMKRGDNLDDD